MINPLRRGRLVLFGAGMTGRGQVAQLAYEDGWDITLIDKNKELVDILQRAGEYTVQLLSSKTREVAIREFRIFHTSEQEQINRVVRNVDLIVTSVLEPNLPDVATILAHAITARYNADVRQPVNVIAAENMGDSTSRLYSYIKPLLPSSVNRNIQNIVGFPNSMISRVVPIADDPLHIKTEEYSEWTADKDGRIGTPPPLKGLEWVQNQPARLFRKLYIHNTGHMICGSLGWLKKYHYIHEAALDSEINTHITNAIAESGDAVSKEFGFQRDDVKSYEGHLLGRLIISELPDDIRRVIRHPIRKLGKAERLIGPLLLCEKYNLPCTELCNGIAAVMAGSYIPYVYHDYDNQYELIRESLEKTGPIKALSSLTGYQPKPSTARLIEIAFKALRNRYIIHE